MIKWFVGYWIGNTYYHKFIYADTATLAIKKSKIKNIVELFPVDENNKRIG